MIYLVPFIFSTAIGYYCLLAIKEVRRSLSPLEFFLAIGLGLGISSQIVFYSLVSCNGLNQGVIIFAHAVILVTLFALRIMTQRKLPQSPAPHSQFNTVRFLIVFSPFIVMAIVAAMSRPYGNWDAWSMWNLRANFLFRAGPAWRNIFTFQIQEQHPWLLPFITDWGWALLGREHFLIPLILSIIYTVATVGLLVYGLEERIDYRIAILSGVFLFSIPIFLVHGTSQFADVITCYYMLAASISIMRSVRNSYPKDALLGGIFLGLLGFTKLEGIVSAVIMLTLTIFYLIRHKKETALIRHAILGFLLIAPSFITVKILMTHHESLNQLFFFPGALNSDRWSTIAFFFAQHIFPDPYWGNFWKLAVVGMVLTIPLFMKTEARILFFSILIFLMIVFFRFLTTQSELTWHLSVSLERILLQLAPTIIFMIFYAIKSGQKSSHE